MAHRIAALIDGLYIRRALKDGPPDPASAIALLEDYVDTELTVLVPIPPEAEPWFPGDEQMERRIRRAIRWNAAAIESGLAL